MPSISFITLGCRSNQAETDEMKEAAALKGFSIVRKSEKADMVVVNTCTVTALADKKSRQAVRTALKSGGKVIVTGCTAETDREQIKSIDPSITVISNKDKIKLFDFVGSGGLGLGSGKTKEAIKIKNPEYETLDPRPQTLPRVRSNLLIQTGCENFCTYCIVPYARGKEKSRSRKEIMSRAKRLAASGIKEIVLTGTNIGAFNGLPGLIDEISLIDGIERIRLSSIEPNDINIELVHAIAANEKVCRFLHIPLQSGDDDVLLRMGRKYSGGDFLDLTKFIRHIVPGIAISTDVIAGFPQETAEQFDNTVDLCKRIGFSRMHVFRYSKRKGTPAEKMDGHIDPGIIAKRADILQKTRNDLMLAYHKTYLKKTVDVLIEQKDKKTGMLEGLTGTFVRVLAKGSRSLIGRTVPVTITSANPEFVIGKLTINK